MPAVSVIVPVYGVEKYVERCVEALMRQTLDDVEFIFVDDCTPDGSIDIIKSTVAKWPRRASQVKILHHDKNCGLPAARNTGMAAATGHYVVHIDSDDFCEPTMLEMMLEKARSTSADIVWCNWWLTLGDGERLMTTPEYATADDALRGILNGMMKYNVWNKMARRSLFSDHAIAFPDGHSMGEDMTMVLAFARAGSVAHVAEPLYHYNSANTGAMTRAYSAKDLADTRFNTDRTVQAVQSIKGDSWAPEIARFKLSVKLPFLLNGEEEGIRLWRSWYPEANAYIMGNPELPLRTRLLQFAAARGCDWYVRFYNKFVMGYLYRLIFGK